VGRSGKDDDGLTREEARLRRLARKRSVTDGFELVPRTLSPAGVRAHLAAADIVALPFKLVQAAVPISLLEAMAMGNPVVSTATAGIPELVDDERQLATPGDVSSLTAALQRFVADEALRTAVGSQNRDRMRRHPRWDDARAQFVAAVEALA
jgi:glycosyltransferase involved in cell wall biosynthesis